MLIALIVIAAALVAGFLTNRFLRSRLMGADAEGVSARGLLDPLLTLAVLVLAFVMVMAAESFGSAEKSARTEAGMVDHLFEVAEYAPAAQRQAIQADIVCYTRAVHAVEWPAMVRGQGSTAPSVWTTDLRQHLKEMNPNDAVFEILVDADRERSEARQNRIAEATPAVPPAFSWFMLISLAVTLAALAFCLPRKRRGAEIMMLLVLTGLLTGSLLIIRDIDRPYDGLIAIQPTAIDGTNTDVTEDYIAAYGPASLPCGLEGRPSAAG
ncbi:DUF4239 domain-containing protein [Kitasatospora purpeofusca]|uniref:bestrophin-like domain n=1 Tax=Kitasatospora purpeofusca TaxID=67352 RepID=UPI002E11F174|nr:DUF4239 domain-containing protein [Kitasatospora purpeofusca]WSR45234.1 DUF4239 domain-containing protein [Kitasatospora purpeofusca]